ncbi:NAD(P)-binding protein [Photobacterium sp. SDRW27]|uniref:NAD(P)-binding protein n=1 Tax=Photobacterium obscurum TaxID=2829490 RepID=UPI0022447909|nr:NAD(P)-binding protein [Photobacterium obscurum]MCW8329976.1 NAD(P)-binding protein [Photobacterium obscurum]
MNVHGSHRSNTPKPLKVGIIGGGIAGSTIALRLAELGIDVELFEEGSSLVNGPPICHLHAGGNLYREISDQQCLTLLQQSIDTLRVFPHTANIRPTVIAIPERDAGEPEALLPRLALLQETYHGLVQQDSKNQVLGEPEYYYKVYYQDDLERLARSDTPSEPKNLDDWMIPVAKNLNLNEFKFPLILVQEYGLSVFRLAATAGLALEQLPACSVNTQAKVINIQQNESQNHWSITYQQYDASIKDHITHSTDVDYLINACGYRTGTLDDMADLHRTRMVEFKAAFVTQWKERDGVWPEVIFHGERGTPNGMAQLTPYPDGYFQLHGMTEDITLFRKGLVSSSAQSAQPQLGSQFIRKLKEGWQNSDIETRTDRAIQHMAQFIPAYRSATVGGKPLFGAQQIPGDDPSLRAADISFAGSRYARTEIVKASSALSAANRLVQQFKNEGLLAGFDDDLAMALEQRFPVTSGLNQKDVITEAEKLASERSYPPALAQLVRF